MLRKTLIAASLLIASGSALAAHDGYIQGRVITVEPSISVSFGGGHRNDGFRVLYESGGQRYWTHSDYYPRGVVYVPRPVPVYYNDRSYRRDEGYRDGWRDEHRGGREEHHGWRGHGRDHDEDHRGGRNWGHDD